MFLLDTCALLWLASGDRALSKAAREAIGAPNAPLFVSAISAFEIGIKERRGALALPLAADRWYVRALAHHGGEEIAVDSAIALRSTRLPPLHADPCDRIIVATALRDHLAVLTPDALIRRYPGVTTLW